MYGRNFLTHGAPLRLLCPRESSTKQLDEKTLFGAGGKHEVPLKFSSLEREEYATQSYVSLGYRAVLVYYACWILGPLFPEF